MRIQHNMMAINAGNKLNITNAKRTKSAEKLSSGYRINRAADDAAGLAISEKMRRLIRGLDQGTENAVDGVSWTQIGDGALGEAQDILHRMTELTIKALNETNTEEDRMAMELEFEQLQSEIDRIGTTTTFNEIPIFEEHEIPYYQCEGGALWDPQQPQIVTAGANDLTFKYTPKEGDPQKTMTITVPPGEYTTQELIDEIETILSEKNTDDEQIVLEFTKDGYCNANLEGGEKIDSVSGSLSYLIYDMYKGGGFGALIGTTSFPKETSRLQVVTGQNDYMSFTIEDFAGNSQEKTVQLPQGSHTRSEIIDMINNQLAGTTVKAVAYGTGIKLASDDAIVTGFKGNMFKIDGTKPAYDSVFYDNVKYGSVTQEPAVFTGGYVLPTDSRDEEHKYYVIDSTNNTLTLQPNGAANPVTITLTPDKKYTAAQMVAELNTQFAANNLELTAERIYSGGSNNFDGIKITSGIEGPDSKINIDPSSSAYNTLFVTKEYNSYGSKVDPINETTADREGVFKGSKDLSVLSSEPLTIIAGVNDSFQLSLDGTEYTIKMTAKTYNSTQDVIDELNEQLNGASAPAGYKGKVTVSQSAGKIVLTGATGQNVKKIRATAITGNNGFDNIFQGYNITTTTPTASGTGSVTLNTPYDGNIDSSESSMKITVGGTTHTVNLPTGAVSPDTIKVTIETAIPEWTETKINKFTAVAANGTNSNQNFNITATGTTSTVPWNDSAQGYSEKPEGVVEFTRNEPAVLEIGPTLKSSMPVDASNNSIALTLNGVTKTITLDSTTYTPSTLKTALQQKIDDAFGTGMGGAVVSVNGNKLTLTSRLPDGYDASQTSISCSTSTSTFLKELNTTRTPAVWISPRALASDIVIANGNVGMELIYSEGGRSQTLWINLNEGTYTQSSIIPEINAQIAKSGLGITASLEAGKLKLTSTETGSDVKISYSTASGGPSAEALFGPLSTPGPANAVVNLKTEDSIKIESGVSDTFTIKVNGTDKTVTLDEGTYNRDTFVAMLNQKLAGAGVTAYVSGNKIGYKTTATGTSASIGMTYDGGGNSMKAIYGVTDITHPGVTVSFDAEGRMKLSTTTGTGTISVGTANGGAFQQPVINKTPISTSYTDGYHSTTKSYIDGANLSGDITIDQWNNDLKFTFKDNGVNTDITIEIPQDTYTYAELQTKLQELIDTKVGGSGKITATVSNTGVRLESVNVGSKYQFSGFSGDFYDKVICPCTEKTETATPKNKDGTQTVSSAYTVGRKDVKSNGAEIRAGISDEFSLDLTYGGVVHTLSVTLDPGKYSSEQLKSHLQAKLNEKLNAIGLPANLIEVGVGGINTGVFGANDDNALNFSLSKTAPAPDEGQFIIDGVSGNAAFEIFYQTDGKLEPAYLRGNEDLTEGVTILPGETDMTLAVDGVEYPITIPEGEHTAQEILNHVNDALTAAGAPVVAELDEGRLRISHKKMGEHTIEVVSGDVKYKILFGENGISEELDPRYVKLSSEEDDKIGLNRHRFSTVSLGINSCCISQTKNAEKALGRIKEALHKISFIRSDFGSTQNRLEHAIANNDNKYENLQSAESVIRDTDMAKEMVAYSNHSILQQAGEAILAQANQSYNGVLSLLNG